MQKLKNIDLKKLGEQHNKNQIKVDLIVLATLVVYTLFKQKWLLKQVIHIYTEKPMAANLEDDYQMVEIARK